MLNTLGSSISRLLLRPHGDVTHLGGANATTHTQTNRLTHTHTVHFYGSTWKDSSEWGLPGSGDGQRDRATAGSPSVPRL